MKTMKPFVDCLAGLCLATVAAITPPALAQDWPSRPLRLVVPYPPGSGPDLLARALSERLTKALPQATVVENRAGAAGVIGTQAVVGAAPDGHTLLVVDRAGLISNPLLAANVPYKWETDLKAVTNLAAVSLFIVAGQGAPFNSYKSFIDHARANPGRVNFGSSGMGDISHVSQQLIATSEGVSFTHVPYQGLAPAVVALLGGQIDVLVSGPVPIRAPLKDGRVKLLAVGTRQRSPTLPEAPTVAEAGGANYELPSTVFVVMAPGKTPDDLVARVNVELRKAASDPAFVQQFQAMGLVPATSTPAEALSGILSIRPAYEALIKASGTRKE